jgi:hypothetical protein
MSQEGDSGLRFTKLYYHSFHLKSENQSPRIAEFKVGESQPIGLFTKKTIARLNLKIRSLFYLLI